MIYLYEAGTVWTSSSHIITAVIGSGVLSLAWGIAQLGWVAGPAVMIFFSVVTLYTSYFLADCYRAGDPNTGKRNYTFMDAVSTILGKYMNIKLLILFCLFYTSDSLKIYILPQVFCNLQIGFNLYTLIL